MEAIAAAARQAGRDPGTVKLVGASKTVTGSTGFDRLWRRGSLSWGKIYLQEAREKIAEFDLPVQWHFIGHLQLSNKAAAAVKLFSLIHSVDRPSLARALNGAAAKNNQVQDILLEVNLGQEPTKSGAQLEDLEMLLRTCAALPNLRVRGLMTMPPWFNDPEKVRPYFQTLRQNRDHLQSLALPGVELAELSMGMSGRFPGRHRRRRYFGPDRHGPFWLKAALTLG